MKPQYEGKTWGWAIAHDRGLMHTNWLIGRGNESYPGMLPVGLFTTRTAARKALKRLVAWETDLISRKSNLPFQAKIVKVVIAESGSLS